MRFPNKLKVIMARKGLTATELAKKSKLAKDTIDSYVQGRNDLKTIKLDTLLKLCSALKITPYRLFDDEFAKQLRKWRVSE